MSNFTLNGLEKDMGNIIHGDWSKEEEKTLKKYYSVLGTKVQQFIPNRTLNAIDHKVRVMGLKYIRGLAPDGKSGYFDIETTGLRADFAVMLSWYIKTANEEEYLSGIITPKELSNPDATDKRIVTELIEALRQYKKIFTYYGTEFDIPFTRARAMYHHIDFLPYGLVGHKDVYYLARKTLCIHSKRLESVCDLMEISGKTHLSPRLWSRAPHGDAKAIEYIAAHNKADVVILEKVHKKLLEYEAGTRHFI